MTLSRSRLVVLLSGHAALFLGLLNTIKFLRTGLGASYWETLPLAFALGVFSSNAVVLLVESYEAGKTS